jgi:hypothetical protein
MMTFERTRTPEMGPMYNPGATSETYRSADGHEVKILPGREWINITLPDGRTERVLSRFESNGREVIPFPRRPVAEARPFAEALVAALGGRICEEGPGSLGRPYLVVVVGEPPLPPLSLSETNSHDEDE